MPNRPDDPKAPLSAYWDRPVSDLVQVENAGISPGEAERHCIFSLLTLAIVSDAFNGNRKGPLGTYPWRAKQQISAGRYSGDRWGDRYFGHNIASIAVDGRGEIIDFDFNHNDLFNSSVEHAEARLVRRVFNLNQAFDNWQTIKPDEIVSVSYGNVLNAVTVYTSLESCAQCSGIMTLGNVKSVVYLQNDPGQYCIGNILYNLSNTLDVSNPSKYPPVAKDKGRQKYGAPEPVSANLFGFSFKDELDKAYAGYRRTVKRDPAMSFFVSNDGKADSSDGVTSFLCTDEAKEILERAASALDTMSLTYGDYAPAFADGNGANSSKMALSNAQVLMQAQLFRAYAARTARRGTSHR